ncbi:superinfection immunity protein [Aminobacter aganoensis]|nr:superinfection immunity protein [Aminobacter aganoensis]
MIPTIVAFWRRHPNRWVILLLNIFLGATGIVGSAA